LKLLSATTIVACLPNCGVDAAVDLANMQFEMVGCCEHCPDAVLPRMGVIAELAFAA
jgi:hypothetical protein